MRQNRTPRESHQGKKAVVAAGVGAAAGAGTSAYIGGIGLSAGGAAIGIGMAPVAVAGAVIGLAAYGIYRAFKK